MRRALVTGAGGFVGGNLVERLLADGDRVRALVRAANAPGWLEERGAEIVVGDLTDAAVRTRAVADCDVVFHAASYVTLVNATEADYLRVNAEASAELARAAAGAGVSRFVFVSSTGIYAPSPVPVDEQTPAAPDDAYGRSKLEAERRLERVSRETGLGLVTLRPARVYGPRDRALAPAIRGVARRRFPLVGRGDARVDFLYVGDLVDALVAASRRGSGAYLVGGPESVTIRDFFAAFAGALGTRLLPFHLPVRATLAASAAVAFAFARAGVEPPVAPKKIAFFLNTRRVSNERARRELDWRPVVRVPEGARKTVVWYRSAKWL